jgi:hypothetical protein
MNRTRLGLMMFSMWCGSAMAQAPGSVPAAVTTTSAKAELPTGLLPVLNKWNATLYGFVEADFMSDSTESFNDLAGNAAIVRPGTYAGSHRRATFSLRNTRIGFRFTAPEFAGIRSSALTEMDFLGNQPPNASEASFFTSPTFRIRHAALRLESEYVDVLIGQYWQLFGLQPYFHPNTVDLQGIPGQIYSRSPQIRLSHVFKSDAVNFEVAVAGSRPPQRDSQTPDGQAGIKLMLNHWTGVHTAGGTGTSADPLAIGISGALRRFNLPQFSATPTTDVSNTGWAYSIDLLLPVIASTMKSRANGLTLTASFVNGSGFADLYTGLSGGISFPSLPGGATYPANIDNGLVTFAPDGTLQTIDWRSFLAGLQYYLPPEGKLWVSGNFSQMYSDNIGKYAAPGRVFDHSWWADGNIFWDITPAVRLGLEYAYFHQTYTDGVNASNHRFQFSGWYLF